MTDPEDHAPFQMKLDEDDLATLADGETLGVLLEVRGERWVDVLELNWKTKGTRGGRTVRDEWPELFEDEQEVEP